MISSLNNILETVQSYQTVLAPKIKELTLSSFRPPLFIDFLPFKSESFQNKPSEERPQQSFISLFFMTFINIIFIGFYILIILFLAMIVANDMIVLPPIYRFLGFIFTIIICTFPPGILLFSFYYGLRAIYAASMNLILSSPDSKPISYFPRIFAILPLTTTQYESSTARFLM